MYVLPKLSPEEILDYLRKSQSDDPLLTVEEVLAKHEKMLDDWVQRNLPGLGPVPEKNRIREVVSGETLESRPGMMDLLHRIESPKIKAVLCVEPQRLSRGSLKDIGHLVELLRYSNTIVITMQYTYDLRDDRDRDLFERELMRGNEYLEYYKRIQQNGRLASVRAGNFIGQRPPYGYKKIMLQEGKTTCPTLEPHPDQAPVVKMIFEMYRDGMGMVRISDRLNELHIPSPTGKKWTRESIPGILANVHYIGKVRWNYRPNVKRVEDGVIVVSRPRTEDFLVYDGKQPAIIDQELWDAVQARRGKIPRVKKNNKSFNPLAGIMYCECGKAVSARPFKNNGKEYCEPRFLCSGQRYCGNASAVMSDVMDDVKETLKEAIADFEMRIEKGEDDSAQIHRQLVERLEKRLIELRELEVKQWDEKTKGGMPAHVFERLNSQTVEEMHEVEEKLCTARNSVPEPINLQEKVTNFHAALNALDDPHATIQKRNKLLKLCIERITYSRKRTGNNGHPVKGEETDIELDYSLRV